jgi:tRNA threonylcarbamoyladenosine biosynthesis protein TsaE
MDQTPEAGPTLCARFASEDETLAAAAALARELRAGDLIGLQGDLGAGKTTFVRGLAHGLGVDPDRVRSPTFTLVNEYGGGRLPLFHIDLYRLVPAAVDRMALREYLYGDGVCVVEWIDRLGEDPPRLHVTLAHAGEEARTVVVRAIGRRYDALVSPRIWEETRALED